MPYQDRQISSQADEYFLQEDAEYGRDSPMAQSGNRKMLAILAGGVLCAALLAGMLVLVHAA